MLQAPGPVLKLARIKSCDEDTLCHSTSVAGISMGTGGARRDRPALRVTALEPQPAERGPLADGEVGA
jgi:hypothetical protein